MELKYNHLQENFMFVMNCISTCETAWQLKTAHNMVERFKDLYKEYDLTEMESKLLDNILQRQVWINTFACS